MRQDWYVPPGNEEPLTFISFARTEGRFRRHFDDEGNPSEALLTAQDERLENWRMLQELAGLL